MAEPGLNSSPNAEPGDRAGLARLLRLLMMRQLQAQLAPAPNPATAVREFANELPMLSKLGVRLGDEDQYEKNRRDEAKRGRLAIPDL